VPVLLEKASVAAKLDSEIADATAQNLIVIGGPCANKVAATVSGAPYAVAGCEAGFTEGKAVIKLYANANKVAMLVAGYGAMDTRAASRVVQNYDQYALSGSEVEVSYTDLSHITVSAPTS
jgi:S-layer protein (TIGR01564 family)